MSESTKLKMGEIETDAVCYESGLVAHRLRRDGQPEFSPKELKHLVKCNNCHDDLLAVCKDFIEIHDRCGNPEGVDWSGIMPLLERAKAAIEKARKEVKL